MRALDTACRLTEGSLFLFRKRRGRGGEIDTVATSKHSKKGKKKGKEKRCGDEGNDDVDIGTV